MTETTDNNNSEWQTAPTSIKKKTQQVNDISARNKSQQMKRRVYIGNLRPRPDLKTRLISQLFASGIVLHDNDTDNDDTDGEEAIKIVVKSKQQSSCFALVRCDVDLAVKCLHGTQFDGRILKVHPEKKTVTKGGERRGFGKTAHFGSKGWSCPEPDDSTNPNAINDGLPDTESKLSTSTLHPNHNESTDFQARSNTPLTTLMKEYGEKEDININHNIQSNNSQQPKQTHQPQNQHNRLAPHGKAPIHVEITSFGYKYGCPSCARDGWTHSNPLPPYDCRHLPRPPHYLAKFNGLSYQVKRILLSSANSSSDTGKNDTEKRQNNFRLRANTIADEIIQALVDAISAGYGHASPLQMKIYIGSEYGRHRSVVLGETTATAVRKLLRANEHQLIRQPVSVGTHHRDIEQKHRDDEAFGLDSPMAKKKQERL